MLLTRLLEGKSPEPAPELFVLNSDVEQISTLFLLYPFPNYAVYSSEVTIVTKACTQRLCAE